MVGTRRKSKAAAAAATQHDYDGASTQGTDEFSHPQQFSVPLPIDIDVEALSSLIPEVSFATPTPETIVSVYRLLLAQVAETNATQRDLEEARAEVERREVELDQAYQDVENKTKSLETSLENVQSQLTVTRQEKEQLATSKSSLEAQLSNFSASQSTSSTELDQLKHRVEDAEREKRDLMGVVNRLKEDATQRDDEVQNLRNSLRQARQEHQSQETQVRELRSSETSNKFKIDSLTQQLQLAQSEVERATVELSSKIEEHANYRRTRHAEFATLQAAHDSLTQQHSASESAFKALQSAHSSQSHQLTQALARVQDLTGQLAEQEAAFTSEASGLRRLVNIMEEREKQAKEIVEGIEREWAGVGERAERREAALHAEVEKEKQAREEAERKVDQLETVLERMNRGELPVASRATPVPGTPATPARNSSQAAGMEGMLGLSPTVAMVSRAQKTGKTFTEVYADYVRLQDEFAKKSSEYDHMDRTLSAVLAQIEERAPILSQQREEYDRLQSEAAQLASQLSTALAEREANSNAFQEASQKLKKSHSENELLQRQLDDLGRQVQALLKELGRRTDPSLPTDAEMEEMEPLPAENIDAVITNNLVLFRSIGGLQEQNQKLLKIVRELGSKMEAEEREYREALEQEQSEAVREAHEAIQDLVAQLERQKKSSDVTIQAYMKERDALKAMFARAERSGLHAGINGDINGVPGSIKSDLAAELEDVQAQFEAYKTEMGTDSVKLREDLQQAHRDLGQVNVTLAKANAKIEYLTDRHRMSQDEATLHTRDLDNLTKRNQQLYDQYIRIDIECNRAQQELSEANSRVEQLRNENANLRAEKKIWESVQVRLVQENKTLSVERSHLADLMANVQRMHGDLERSGENDRRRLENQIQAMDDQMKDMKAQLSQERDAVRYVTLQKDIDSKDLQTRLDKTTEQLSQVRESLVGAETSKIHLQERIDQLTRQLQGNEEKLAVYERRPSVANGAVPTTEQDLPREQQLEQEVAELRSALKVAQVDLAAARSHMQQFQEISQANEAALSALNATHDQYKTETEAQISKNELEYKALQDKLRSVEEDVRQSTDKFSELQRTFESERLVWTNDKKTLEDTIVDLSTSERTSETDRTTRESEVRQQEERALAAEDRYSREVIVHAESIKTIETLKRQLSVAQATSRENLSEAANAQAKLAASEGSWKQQKEALDKEIADLNARSKDLSAQNALLHQHLETVSTQATRIRQAVDSSTTEGTSGDADVGGDVDTKVSELRSVVAYLRKEKEIVDLQLELSKQENVRLKAQIEHLTQSLQETRATLAEERERAMEAATSDAQHAEMLERINQFNIVRESNATLRAECETYAKRSRELDAKLQALSTELEPVKEQARVAQAELQARDAQITRLEGESRRWQERNAQLLSKYDRTDPAEIQTLKDEIETLKTQKANVEKLAAEHEERANTIQARLSRLEVNFRMHKESNKSSVEKFKSNLGLLNNEKSQLNATISELEGKVKTLTAERDTLRTTSAPDASQQLNSQLETLRQEKVTLEQALANERAAKFRAPAEASSDQAAVIASLREERDRLLAEKEALNKVGSSTLPSDAARLWESEKLELIKARDEALARATTADDLAKKASDDVRNLRQSNEKFQARAQEMHKAREKINSEQAALVAAAVEKAKSEITTGGASVNTEELSRKHTQELEALRAELTAQHEAALKAAVDAATKAAKTEAATSPSDESTKAAIAAAIAAHDAELQERHSAELDAAVERGRLESQAKSKIKDGQLVRSQVKLKDLEAQVLEWRKAGLIPEAPPPQTPTASTSKMPPPVTPTASTSQSATASTQVAPAPSTTAVKPAAAAPAGQPAAASGEKPPTSGAVPLGVLRGGRGRIAPRGTGRGGTSTRGAAPGRGGAPPPAPATSGTTGISIIGAASKRSREEDLPADDSLAKRLKPAAETTIASKPPVTLRRPPPS
jgi:nucleoprotein TPR